MNLDSFTGPGSTPSRRRFWDKIVAAVNASRKIQGDNVSVEEHEGMGTIINVPLSNRRPLIGACCAEDNSCTITTEADCAGTFQGVGTVCDPNPCGEGATGACCTEGVCSILSAADCTTAFGYYFGDGTDCDPNPCADIGCCINGANCIETLADSCDGIFTTPGTFCWPQGDRSGFDLVSCCFDGDMTCNSGGTEFFCCTPPLTCCADDVFLVTACCDPTQTCCPVAGRCCSALEVCDPEFGCI